MVVPTVQPQVQPTVTPDVGPVVGPTVQAPVDVPTLVPPLQAQTPPPQAPASAQSAAPASAPSAPTFSQQELDQCRPMAMRVAGFCAERWNMQYEEIVGSTALLEALLKMPDRLDARDGEFVVVGPGEEIDAGMFVPGSIADSETVTWTST